MTRSNVSNEPDLLADPFGERTRMRARKQLHLLGARFRFESNSPRLLQLVDSAFAGLPRHRLSDFSPHLSVRLLLAPEERLHARKRSEPPRLSMLSGPGFLGAATESSNFTVLSPSNHSALVAVSRQMLRFPYHTRYEFIEFAVFSLASRSQGLVSLHAACVGLDGRGILLMGPSGSGKSTVTLLSVLQGLSILSEDSVFVAPETMLATGVTNFLHLRSDSLRWVAAPRHAEAIRKSPTIKRRSGVRKFEIDLRRGAYKLAASPLKIAAVIFLSPHSADGRPLLKSLSKSAMLAKLKAEQAYAANQPGWATFSKNVSRLNAYELRRGHHPLEAIEALKGILRSKG
jgi:energy-coupling factor transporter ATP-binding protein EcfA2